MSYREDRGSRRSRSRSRDRDRRDAPKDRVDERNRDKGDRDRNDRDRADRDRDTRVDRDSRSDRDRSDRDRSDRDREDVRPKEKKLTRAELEALKKERVALVKRLTHGGDSDDEEKPKEGIDEDGMEGFENTEQDISKLLGFGGFGSTKGKQVSDNKDGAASGAVSKHKERKYRQYMNRKAGFNRPLQAMP